MRTSLAFAFLLCLTACSPFELERFESKSPLFSESRGECPFAQETILVEWRQEESGKTDWGEPIVYAPEGNHCVTRASADADPVGVQRLFVPISPNLWIVQSQRAETYPSYSLASRNGDRLEFYRPICSDFQPQTLVGAGVNFDPVKATPTVSEKPEPAPVEVHDKPTEATSSTASPPRKPVAEPPMSTCTATRADGLERLFRTWRRQGHKPDWMYRLAPA